MELVLAALERLVAAGGGSHAPIQIIVHQCPGCAAATVTTSAGERALAPAQVAALACDAQVAEPGKPNRCSMPGCGATAFLEVHHVTPRSRGGSNKAANLVTLCGRCHAFVHDIRVASRPIHGILNVQGHGAGQEGAQP